MPPSSSYYRLVWKKVLEQRERWVWERDIPAGVLGFAIVWYALGWRAAMDNLQITLLAVFGPAVVIEGGRLLYHAIRAPWQLKAKSRDGFR
jgi:hypothetical protein